MANNTPAPGTEYIFFQADQVLTNNHLNELFSFLDQQNRWTRNKLMGNGIVCGLNLTYDSVTTAGITNTTVSISRGSGITSQGYLILQPQDTPTVYTHYIAYTGIQQPPDMPFQLPPQYYFYLPPTPSGATPATAITPAVYSLLESPATPLPAGTFPLSNLQATLDNYVVVLFLEISETSLGNCTTQDCNNKGEQMTLAVRPLLVPKSAPNLNLPTQLTSLPNIRLKRYNVPVADLTDSYQVIDAFKAITDDITLDNVASALVSAEKVYNSLFNKTEANFGAFAAQLSTMQKTILTGKAPYYIQYFVDYVNDIILAYDEFRQVAAQITPAQCYANENAFPLHLVLGEATGTTNELLKDDCRCYFTASHLLENQNATSAKLGFLFNRLKIMATAFNVKAETVIQTNIKITTSQYRDCPLSARAIPYYYVPSALPNNNSLYYWWNFEKTLAANENTNLGYNAAKYLPPADDSVVNPLLYDIEAYNFFRIEGHIGQQYNLARANIHNQILKFNLPFDVVAISSSSLNTDTTPLPTCNVADLETAYKILASDFSCKLFLYVYQFTIQPKVAPTTTPASAPSQTQIKLDSINLLHDYKMNFSHNQSGDLINHIITNDTSSKSVGSAFINELKTGTIDDKGLVISDPTNFPTATYAAQIQLLNTVNILSLYLLNTKLSDFNTTTFSTNYSNFNAAIAAYIKISNDASTLIDDVLNEDLASIEKDIELIANEYLSRVKSYTSQLNFLNYFKSHPGFEHKAGVTKGGTFVMVYHEAPPVAPVEPQVSNILDNLKKIVADPSSDQNIIANANNIIKIYNDNVANETPPPPAYVLNNGAIIADFFVPYMCSSDCAPVAYVLDNKPTAYNVTGGGTICSDSKEDISIKLSGSDTSITYYLVNSSAITTNGIDISKPVTTLTGTGGKLNFGTPANGTYAVVAMNAAGNAKNIMTGSATITVNPAPAAISGPATVPIGVNPITLQNTAKGGSWSSSDITIATVDPTTGVVTGVKAGSVKIIYTMPGNCATSIPITVQAATPPTQPK